MINLFIFSNYSHNFLNSQEPLAKKERQLNKSKVSSHQIQSELSHDELIKLRQIQWADLKLYSVAAELFEKFESRFKHVVEGNTVTL